MKNPLRIAQVATVDISISLLLLDQINVLQAMGHHVTVVCSPGPNVDQLRALGYNIETVPMRRELAPLSDLRSLLELIRLFRRHRFDVVHTHTPKAGLIGPLAARIAGVPLIVHTIHGLMFHDRMNRGRQAVFWLAEKHTATCAHHLLSQSEEDLSVATRTRLCSLSKISYLGNGIDVDRFSAPPSVEVARARAAMGFSPQDIVVGFVGRLVLEKGVLELIGAINILTKSDVRLKLLVVGPEETDQSDSLAPSLIRELKAQGKITFAGFQPNMPYWYSAMDIFVLPSYREGIPRAAMEAAAMGLPVVASDIRGCREVVSTGKTGELVPLKNILALAAAISRLSQDSVLRRRMGAAGAERIREKFDRRLVHDRLRSIYTRQGGAEITQSISRV